MTTPHRGTPELWEFVTELRDRIAALEDAANCRAILGSSPAPDGGLMQSVGAAICAIADCGDTPSNWAPEARAAILAVARWLEHRNPGALQWAALLREEVERHG